jgi:hypothetical protein
MRPRLPAPGAWPEDLLVDEQVRNDEHRDNDDKNDRHGNSEYPHGHA